MNGNASRQHGMGWIRDYPDHRDLRLTSKTIRPMMETVMGQSAELIEKRQFKKLDLPAFVDLRSGFSPVEDQGKIESCTAHVVSAIAEYLEQKAFSEYSHRSRLFLYKATKNLLRAQGNVGVFLRTAMGALRLFGAPPEEYWPYDLSKQDEEPPAFCYAFAANYKSVNYVRLDTPDIDTAELLMAIKTQLAAGFPLAFGTMLFDTPLMHASRPETLGQLPYPCNSDRPKGGHAMVAVGYDDSIVIEHSKPDGSKSKGAILIRNSWGTGWGKDGYGWLPYSYIQGGLSVDWWVLLKQDWVDTGVFGLNC
ncbi:MULTISPECIES: C1 family peptidase [Trichocoleus]|uniref:C1 family peptidase n=1 Tax=Trichocoleus desertorum GB2-A4 TaxID=2933944 RepID=A0ABV0JBY8_9CYAN|nr:C1 family peptidase [Trichocoleus sp. FACHB-46]MBD1865421.1 C1 family peptidase [Trichocoleus sp. FACHB-46]